MDVRQLETFLWIARLGSISEACKRLKVTQSTLSMRLKALEEDLGVPLFDRSHKRLTLRAKGRELLKYAEKILETVEQVRLYVADPTAESGTIRVGLAELVALTWAPDLIRRLSAQYPNVVIDLDVGLPRPLIDALADGKLDVVLAQSLSKPDTPFVGLPLGSVRFSWMASPSLRLGKRLITPVDFEKLAIIGAASSQSVFYSVIQQWFNENGATIQRLNVCNSLAATASMVIEGIGVGLLPDDYCAPYIKAGTLQILRTNRTFEFEFYALYSALGGQALPKLVAEMACVASTFRRASTGASAA